MPTADGRPVVVLATSNGHGMGHLTRQLAVAKALQDRADTYVFTLSRAMPVVLAEGLRGEYCPSHDGEQMPHPTWHRYLRDRVVAFCREVGADVLLFDGVQPYLGLLQARAQLRDTAFVWSRRGMWVPGYNDRPLRLAAPFFDAVVEPGDLAADFDRGPTRDRGDAVRTGVVSMLGAVAPLPRTEAAAVLGLDPARRTVLVTLGSGVLGDAATPGEVAIRALLEDPEWQVAVTRASIARSGLPLVDAARVVEIRGVYPLARYLAAFDAVVTAAGYNAIHEFIPAGLPTLVVANPATSTDDQRSRARGVAARGLALAAEPDDTAGIAAAARSLSDPAVRARLAATAAATAATDPLSGATETADVLLRLGGGFSGHRPGPRERALTAELAARSAAMHLLGPDATQRVRRALGRRPPKGPVRPLRVRPVEEPPGTPDDAPLPPREGVGPLLLTDRMSPAVMAWGGPVEHVLRGSSAGYRAARRRLAGQAYDLGAATP